MSTSLVELQGARVLQCAPDGALLRADRDVVDLVAAAFETRAEWVAIPVSRLGGDFFRLITRIAGEMLQKFVTYHLRVAVVGDISDYLEVSAALRDFVAESNRGTQVWFVATIEEFSAKLKRTRSNPG